MLFCLYYTDKFFFSHFFVNYKMDTLDDDTLLSILDTARNVVLGLSKVSDLDEKLLVFNVHQRQKLVHDLIFCLKRGMAYSLELEPFNELVDSTFVEQTILTKAIKAYWKRGYSKYPAMYAQNCPLDNNLKDFKWVASLPSDAKFGVSNSQPTIKCIFQTTSEAFSLDLTPDALQDLAQNVQNIQNAIQNISA